MNEPKHPHHHDTLNSPATSELPASPETKTASAPKKKTSFRLKLLVALVALLLPFIATLAFLLPLPIEETKTVIIPHGISVQEIAATLQNNGVPLNIYMFRLAAKILANNSLKAGEYQCQPRQSLAEIVFMMNQGRAIVRLFTVPEGLTSHEIVKLLQDDLTLSGNIKTVPPEGSLLPESYRYIYGDNRANLVERMQKSQRELLNDLWAKRDPDVPLKTPQEAVTMASIIEKETGKKAEERARVAGVFYNRLRQGMRLQSDPTVIYALTKGQKALSRELTHNDMAIASPYNTYMNYGLPPGPISNPGRASLEAALHPEKNAFLYFVTDGKGGHAFAKDLIAHNKNINHWLNPPKKTPVPKQKPKS